MSSLKGKVAVVTGASKGIGAEISRGLAEAGASVAVTTRLVFEFLKSARTRGLNFSPVPRRIRREHGTQAGGTRFSTAWMRSLQRQSTGSSTNPRGVWSSFSLLMRY